MLDLEDGMSMFIILPDDNDTDTTVDPMGLHARMLWRKEHTQVPLAPSRRLKNGKHIC